MADGEKKNIGGRFCADVVGAKVLDGILEIIHVEVESLAGKVDNDVESLEKRKFTKANKVSIRRHFKKMFGFSGKVTLEKMYVATWCTPGFIDSAKTIGVSVYALEEFIRDFILPAIVEWRKHPPHLLKRTDSYITLPESLWLLKLLDFMSEKELLHFPDSSAK
jgi:hypothetical protein